MSAALQDFNIAVMRELARARAKHPNEEWKLTDTEWLTVLMEEVGECARALLDDEGDVALRAELTHVAAVATRWALSLTYGRGPAWASPQARA